MSATTRSALAATVLAVPVLAEIAWPSRLDSAGGHVFFAASQLVGWALLASARARRSLRGARRVTARPAPSSSRAAPCRSRSPRSTARRPSTASPSRRRSWCSCSASSRFSWAGSCGPHDCGARRVAGLAAAGLLRGRRPGRPGDARRQRPVPRRLPRVVLRGLGRRRARLRPAPGRPHRPGRAGRVFTEPDRGRNDRQCDGRHRDPKALNRCARAEPVKSPPVSRVGVLALTLTSTGDTVPHERLHIAVSALQGDLHARQRRPVGGRSAGPP